MRFRTAICVALLAITWAMPAAAQSMVEMALTLVVSTQDGVAEEVHLSTELKERCARSDGLKGLCDELEALEGRSGSLAMARLLELDAIQLHAWPIKWQTPQEAGCPVAVDGSLGGKTRPSVADENVYIRGFGTFSVKQRTPRSSDGSLDGWIDWDADGDFGQLCADAIQDHLDRGADSFLAEVRETRDDAIRVGFLYTVDVDAGEGGAAPRAGGGPGRANDGLSLDELWGYGLSGW